MSTSPGDTLILVAHLPFPWPPKSSHLLHRGQHDRIHVELIALADGRLHVVIVPSTKSFLSQPIITNSDGPRTVIITILHSDTELSVLLSGQKLLSYNEAAEPLVLSAEQSVLRESALNDPNAVLACQQWIQNRKAKFSQPSIARPNRQLKTIEDQASDLCASILRMRHLAKEVVQGNHFLLGTLAGEMRASIYWLEGKDAVPEKSNNPLLLRTASLADLPLPVYLIPKNVPEPAIVATATMDYDKSAAPRLVRLSKTDEVRDLQESLVSTVLTLGRSGRAIKARDLIKELANTMGASHYDEDASDFLNVLQKMETAAGDHVTIFMCQTADVLISLSEWVLFELKSRNIIG